MKTPASRYYGGKTNMLKHIIPMIPQHKSYLEPFFGGGSVLFAKNIAECNFINDKDGFVTNFWEVFFNDDKRAELLKRFSRYVYSEKYHKEAREVLKNQDKYSEIERAWAFYFLASCSFAGDLNSGFTYSYKSNFGVRFFNKLDRIEKFKNVFRNKITIFNRDAVSLITQFKNEESLFIYADPPYLNANMGHYDGYTEEDFKSLLDILSIVKGKFLLSFYPSPILDKYIKKNNWKFYQVSKKVTVDKAKEGKHAKTKIEQLTYNYNLPHGVLFR